MIDVVVISLVLEISIWNGNAFV